MVPFEQMPPDAKVWVYGAKRRLTAEEQTTLAAMAASFISSWTAHEKKVTAGFAILHDVFLVLMVDEREHGVSGCGIDKSVAFFKSVDQQSDLGLFNRMQIELLKDGEVVITDKAGVSELLRKGEANAQTITFNKMVSDKSAFDAQFRLPLDRSWFYPAVKIPQLAD